MASLADDLKKCTVRIGGVFYQLVTKENEQYTRQIAAHADEMIQRIMAENEQLNQTMATVLALVNVLDDLGQSKMQQQGLAKSAEEARTRAAADRKELEGVREQYWELKKELLAVQELNQDYQTLLNKLTRPDSEKVEQPAALPLEDEELPDLIESALADTATEKEPEQLRQTDLADYLAAFGQDGQLAEADPDE